MTELTTVRILHQETVGNVQITLATAKQGLVLIIQDGTEPVSRPFRWDDVLDILPGVRGEVVWP